MRLENSPDMSVWRADGSSPFLKREMVGSDSSSATQGASLLRVAGRKRAPTKQCAEAPVDRPDSKASARAAGAAWRRDMRDIVISSWLRVFEEPAEAGCRITRRAEVLANWWMLFRANAPQ